MLRNRPVALLCLLFSGGVAAGLFLSFSITLTIISVLLITACLLIWRLRAKLKLVTLGILFICAGMACAQIHKALSYTPNVQPKKEYTINVQITSIKSTAYGMSIQAKGIDGEFDGIGFRMYCDDLQLKEGYKAEIIGELKESDLGDKANGVDFIVSSPEITFSGESGNGISAALLRARGNTDGFIKSTLGDDEIGGFYSALFTGNASGLTNELNASFARSGISHILVVSGQHFSLIIMNIYSMLMYIIRRKRLCSGIAIVLTILFALFTGASPSVVRAAFMCCMVFVLNFATTKSDSINSLMLSLAVILMFSPYSVLSISLQLSFLSTFGVVLVGKYLHRFTVESKFKERIITFIVGPLSYSLAASLFCMPVFIYAFDTVSVFAPLTNALINILLTPMFVIGVPCLVLGRLLGLDFCIWILNFFYTLVRKCSDWIAGMKYASLSVSLPYIRAVLLPSLTAILVCPFVKLRRGFAIITTSICCMIAIYFTCFWAYKYSLKNNSLLFVRDGDSSAYIIAADENGATLIDMRGRSNAKGDILSIGFTYIDNYIVTECTHDAFSRLKNTLPYIPVGTIYLPSDTTTHELKAGDFKRLAYENNVKVEKYETREKLKACNNTISFPVIQEAGAFILNSSCNNSSVAVYGKANALDSLRTQNTTAVIITKDFSQNALRVDLLPKTTSSVYFNTKYQNAYISEMYRDSDIIDYKSTLHLRFGKDGLKEVKQ